MRKCFTQNLTLIWLGTGLLVLANTGCLSTKNSAVTPLGQPLRNQKNGGFGSPQNSKTAIELLEQKNQEQEGGWLAWTRPVSDRFKRTTEALMVTKGKPKRPHDRLSLDVNTPPTPDLYLGAAEYAASTGQLKQARDMLEKGLAVESRDDLKISLARILARQGEFNDAEQRYRELLAATPNSALIHNDLGMLYDQMEQKDRSEYHFDQACLHDPGNRRYQTNLATHLIQDDRFDEARQKLMEGVDSQTADLTIYSLLRQQGRMDAATQYWQSARRQNLSMPSSQPLSGNSGPGTSVDPPVSQPQAAPASGSFQSGRSSMR